MQDPLLSPSETKRTKQDCPSKDTVNSSHADFPKRGKKQLLGKYTPMQAVGLTKKRDADTTGQTVIAYG